MLRSIHSVNVTLWMMHSFHQNIFFCVFLTITSSFVHFNNAALYLTKNNEREFSALIEFYDTILVMGTVSYEIPSRSYLSFQCSLYH